MLADLFKLFTDFDTPIDTGAIGMKDMIRRINEVD